MKKILMIVPLLAVVVFGCSFFEIIAGSGNLVEVQMSHSGFNVLDINAPFDVTVIQDTEYSVTIMVDDNILDHVQVAQMDQTLSIDLNPYYAYNDVTLKAVITVPFLEGLELSSASTVTVIDSASLPSVSSFSVVVDDASHLLLGSIVADLITVNVKDGGKATITALASTASVTVDRGSSLQMNGSAYDLSLTVTGASTADLKDFAVSEASTTISDASEAWVNVDGALRPDITGGSSLYYRGSVTLISPNIAGASSIIQY